jgi:hypothetical protein
MYMVLKERPVKLKYAFIISAAILFLSAPAWGDSIKGNSVIHVNEGFHGLDKFNIVSLGGFKFQDDKHVNIFKFKEDHFVLIVKHEGNNDAPVPTPEPSALSLLLVGSVAFGAFAFRRVRSLVGAR